MIAIGKNIVLVDIEEEVKTDSGLLLSSEDVNNMRYKKAVVIEPGTDIVAIKKGDKIHYDKSRSYKMIINGSQYTIAHENDVVVVLNRD